MIRNRYGGTCYKCGQYVVANMGWWDGGLRHERCEAQAVATVTAENDRLFRELCPVSWAALQKESETNGK